MTVLSENKMHKKLKQLYDFYIIAVFEGSVHVQSTLRKSKSQESNNRL